MLALCVSATQRICKASKQIQNSCPEPKSGIFILRNCVHILPQLGRAKDEPGIQMVIISISLHIAFTKTRYEESDSFLSDHFYRRLAERKWGNGAKQMIKSKGDFLCRFTKH